MTAVSRGCPWLVGVLWLGLTVGAIASPPSAADEAQTLAAAIQRHYEQIRDFRADFTHTYEGGVLRKKTVERGQMAIRKPGRMRWTYTSPEPKVFVSDGVKLYSYVPADKQVIRSRMPDTDEATTAVMFLAGKGNLVRDFDVTYADAAGPDRVGLKLNPRQKQRDNDWLIVVIDRTTLQIRALTAADQQGGRSTFEFSNYRENTGVADNVFAFKIPRGADVINAGSGR